MRDAASALARLESAGVDLVLAGHLHRGFSSDIRVHHPSTRRAIIVAHAGTTISRRHRGEPNAYNWVELAPGHLRITTRAWSGESFAPVKTEAYSKHGQEWERNDGSR